MTKEQAKKVIEMLSKKEQMSKDSIIEIIDMIDEPTIQYVPYQTPSYPNKILNEPWKYEPTITCTFTEAI